MKGWTFLTGTVVAILAAAPAQAQQRPAERADLSRWETEEIVDFFNDPATVRYSGRSRIPYTGLIVGNVASLGGPLIISGEVDGDLIVINGDLIFESGGAVTGDVAVVGGRVLAEELASISGTLTIYDEPLRYVREGERISATEGRKRRRDRFISEFPFGGSRLVVKAGQSYNRVEGLPVIFGPSLRTRGSNPLRLDLFAIWRTDTGGNLGDEDFGYDLRLEQSLGGHERISLGATAYSNVEPVEDWGLSNLEASLATFLLHEDFRDYYDRRGWSGFARLRLRKLPVTLRAEYFRDEHQFAPVGRPWTLVNNLGPWRAQPLVAEGTFESVQGTLIIDTRNDEAEPSDGWLIQARARHGVGGSLFIPEHLTSNEPDSARVLRQDLDNDFFTGFLDARSYNRVGPSSFLNLRVLLRGAMTDTPLPPQFQTSLGGEGSLPGYRPYYGDCGARADLRAFEATVNGVRGLTPAYPAYGCDRMALFQAEYRGNLSFGWSWKDRGRGWDDGWDWYPEVDLDPEWAMFFNAGRGWSADGSGDTETLADVGLGLYLGDLGFYWALPLTEDQNGKRHVNFFVRLVRRF